MSKLQTIIINLTQHAASPEQVAAGVRDLEGRARERLTRLLTFHSIPDRGEIERRARSISHIAVLAGGRSSAHAGAMIGGAPFLMGALESALKKEGVAPLYAFSERCSEEQVLPDGSTKKVAVFRHKGFVPA